MAAQAIATWNHAPGAAPMPRLPLLTWIGNAAAVLFGQHGDVTQPTQ